MDKGIHWDVPAYLIISLIALLVIIILIAVFSGKLYEIGDIFG